MILVIGSRKTKWKWILYFYVLFFVIYSIICLIVNFIVLQIARLHFSHSIPIRNGIRIIRNTKFILLTYLS